MIIAFTVFEVTNAESPWLKEVVWHTQFFRIYNILAWIRQEVVDDNIANLVAGYQLDKTNPIIYNKYNEMGIIRFKSMNVLQTDDILFQIFVFKVKDPSNY